MVLKQTEKSLVREIKTVIPIQIGKTRDPKEFFSEEFDVIIDGNVATSDQEIDTQDDQRFNTERYHKKQHKF